MRHDDLALLEAARLRRSAYDDYEGYQHTVNAACEGLDPKAIRLAEMESERLFDLWTEARLALYALKPTTLMEAIILLQAVRDEEEDVFLHDDDLAEAVDNVIAALKRVSKP